MRLNVLRTGPGGGANSRQRLWESGGKASSSWAIFCKVLEKIGYFNAIWITFRAFSEPFERTKFLRFESQLNKFLSSGQVQNTFKTLHFGVKSCNLAWSGESRYIAFCSIFSIKSSTRRFAFENFCLVTRITSFRNMYDQEPRHPRFNFNNLFNKHFSKLSFFQKHFVA